MCLYVYILTEIVFMLIASDVKNNEIEFAICKFYMENLLVQLEYKSKQAFNVELLYFNGLKRNINLLKCIE